MAYRWLTISWAGVALFFQRDHLTRTGVAVLAIGAAVAFTAWSTFAARNDGAWLMRAPAVVVEASIGAGLLLLDGVIWGGIADETRRQSLPWAWPHAAVLTAAAVFGMRPALAVAAVLAASSWWGELEVRGGQDSWVGVGSKSALYFLAAIGTALVMRRLREASTQISAARAREEMAATLHDGVLQTLAVIQRRSDDTELVDLARRQDRELRAHLWGTPATESGFEAAVAAAAARAAEGYDLAVQSLLPDDLPTLAAEVDHALGGAVAEAITNAAKHAGAAPGGRLRRTTRRRPRRSSRLLLRQRRRPGLRRRVDASRPRSASLDPRPRHGRRRARRGRVIPGNRHRGAILGRWNAPNMSENHG